MKVLKWADVHRGSCIRFRPWLFVRLLGILFTLTTPLLGTVYVSASNSLGSDGTIYVTGVTNAGGMQIHTAWVSVTVTSPKGRQGYGYQHMNSGGYATANASLPFDQTDLGDYFGSANGDGT